MKGICQIWSRGRLISPSMPVGDDWYLNLNSQKRPPGRNLGEHRLVRRSGATSGGTVLVFCLRMRSCPGAEVPTIFMRRSICVGSTTGHNHNPESRSPLFFQNPESRPWNKLSPGSKKHIGDPLLKLVIFLGWVWQHAFFSSLMYVQVQFRCMSVKGGFGTEI